MTKSKSIEVSWNKPKRQYLQQNIVLPQNVPGKKDTIQTVLIAIDTSGQISDQDIGTALAQIYDLLKKYKQHGVIEYWDTSVAAKADFKDIREALRLRPAGGGGTDPNCIFEDLSKDTKFTRKVRRHEIEAILIFTDGCFGSISEEYKKKFGRKTIWIVNDDSFIERGWKAPMGIAAPFK